MFLGKNYILGNELVEKMGIHIANISMLRNRFEDENDHTTMVKMNNCTLVKSNSHKLPRNIREGIARFKSDFTSLHNKLPCTFVRAEYGFTEKELMNSVVTSKITIAGKEFYEFDEDFVKKVRGKIVYPLDRSETMECSAKGQIEGFIQVSKNKFLTWY